MFLLSRQPAPLALGLDRRLKPLGETASIFARHLRPPFSSSA
jgi:hypothetical protein